MLSRKSLALLAIGAVAAAVAVDRVRDDATQPRDSRLDIGSGPVATATREPMNYVDILLKRERLPADVIGEPFAGREDARPAGVGAAVSAAPPPFPYRYAGQFRIDGGGWRVYLLKGNDLVLIKVGDVLDGAFKVSAIGSEDFEIVHLPSTVASVISYASLGTNAAAAQGESAQMALHAGSAASGAPLGSAAPATANRSGNEGAAVSSAAMSSGASVPLQTSPGSVTHGLIPSGQLGSLIPATSVPLGDPPPVSNSMPMDPAPAGFMETLPAPTGRLGV